MVKFSEIHTCIVDKLESKFTNIPVKNINSDKIVRPSFSVDFDGIKPSDFMNKSLERDITVRIYYFSTDKDKNKIEYLDMQDDLNTLFLEDNILEINENVKIQIEELEFDVVDKVLETSFDIFISEDYERTDNTELMEELDIVY